MRTDRREFAIHVLASVMRAIGLAMMLYGLSGLLQIWFSAAASAPHCEVDHE